MVVTYGHVMVSFKLYYYYYYFFSAQGISDTEGEEKNGQKL